MAGTATHEFSIANPSSVPPTSPPDSDQDPAEAARRFLTATFEADGVTMARYTCSRDSEVGGFAGILVTLMLGSANAFLSEFAPGAVASVDFSDVTFSIVSRSGSQATVRAYGQVIFTIGGGFQQRHLDMEIPLVYESRRWRACGNIN